jgi:Undecaprenyl-phosphate glucose phosphotransferase
MISVFLPESYSRGFVIESIFLFYLGDLIFYRGLYTFLKIRQKKGLNTNRILIVGENTTTNQLRKIIESNPILGYNFIGFASDNTSNPAWLGTTDQLEELINKYQIQMVFVSISLLSDNLETRKYLNTCSRMGIRLRFLPENHGFFRTTKKYESLGELITINPLEISLDTMSNRFLKRSFDILFSLVVIVLLLSWALPIIALLIKLSSNRPVFFVQERTGINNKIFNCFKFRSMLVNEDANLLQSCQNDTRITRIGKFLRKTNLDEFPQFFNVLMGDMSVVGPRPHMLQHTQVYAALIDYYLIRHYVKPGITGYAQIKGYRGETDELWKMQRRVECDMEYIENWNFALDLRIIWRTIFHIEAYKNAR